jgi:hypothetical protein
MAFGNGAYLGRGDGPDFKVVRTHKDLVQALSNVSDVPLIKVARLIRRSPPTGFKSSIDQTTKASSLLLLGKDRNVVLEGIRDPEVLISDIRDALVLVPVVRVWQGLVEAVIKVFVVGEDDVSTNIEQLHM